MSFELFILVAFDVSLIVLLQLAFRLHASSSVMAGLTHQRLFIEQPHVFVFEQIIFT